MPDIEGGGRAKNVLGIDEVVRLAVAAGFRGDQLATAVAIAKAETGFDAEAIGDQALQDAKWGPSLGLWQIRSLNAERGTGKTRDAGNLKDPAFNARSAYAISGGGVNFTPWTMYTNRRYAKHLAEARLAVRSFFGGAGRNSGFTPGTTTDPGGLIGGAPPVLAPGPQSGSGAPLPVRIGGVLGAGELGQAITSGTMDFSTSEVSQMTLVLDDPGFMLTERHDLNVGTVVGNYGLRWQVVEFQLGSARHGEIATLRCHPSGAVRLRSSSPSATRQISPTDYLAALARQAGLRFIGEQSAPRDIAPAMIDDTKGRITVQRPQTAWEVGQHWAQQLGFLFFEAAGTLYFGSPKYLAEQGRRMQISWRGMSYKPVQGPVYPALEAPKCKATERNFIKAGTVLPGVDGTTITYHDVRDRLEDITVKASIERTTGEALRPAMRVALAGVPNFDATVLLMTRVSWSLSDLTAPVEVEAATAQVLPGAGRLPEDEQALSESTGPVTGTQRPQGARLNTKERIRYFGQPGDRVRTTLVAMPNGVKAVVHVLIVEQFKAAAAEAFQVSKWRPVAVDRNGTIGNYVARPIRGGTDWSLHSFGLAFDFFNTRSPADVWGPQNAPDQAFRDAFKRHGFHLGSEFRGRKDFPHIEWASAPPS
jgi:hypothetical protein